MKQITKPKQSKQRLKIVKNNSGVFCYHCGETRYKLDGFRTDGVRKYICHGCKRGFSEKKVNSKFIKNVPLGEDVWHADELGLRVSKYKNDAKIIFLHIEQDWLKEAAKKFVRYSAANRQLRTLQDFITAINCFSEFIAETHPSLTWQSLDRNIILDYLAFLNAKQLNWSTKRSRISLLKQLLEIGKINSWFDIPPYLLRPEDFPKSQKCLPRYIPEEVMAQLNQHLQFLPEPVMRMVLVIQETGLRIGELLELPFDCLNQDTKGDWFITYKNYKMKKEDTKPISLELAKVIQEQQKYIQLNLGVEFNFNYLFTARKSIGNFNTNRNFVPKPKVMRIKSFIDYLKKLAKEKSICDSSGRIWNFQSHQFRHTVGTRMINNGVPQHIIQRYLGHETPTMTSVYAHIYDQTLKQEIAKYHDSRVINIAGEVVESITPELDNDLDLHILKKKVLAQSLPNGSCARPIVLGECPHANACFTCGDFRTTVEFLNQHKAQLEETERLVKNAEEKGWKRHAEMNTKVRDNLKKIITTLESGSKDIVSGGDD